jgi:hypothetical protein
MLSTNDRDFNSIEATSEPFSLLQTTQQYARLFTPDDPPCLRLTM